MKQVALIVAALAAGYAGGLLAVSRMRASSEHDVPGVIRARAFELVDEKGQTQSFWGVDSEGNAVLAFTAPPGRPVLNGAPRRHVSPGGIRNPNNQLLSLGLLGLEVPTLKIRAEDGTVRLRLFLTPYGQPSLTMGDEYDTRVVLGILDSDTPGPGDRNWALLFHPSNTGIGMETEKDKGKTYVRGVFFVNRNRIVDWLQPQPK